jgi:phage portal protein BeeE
VTVGLLERIAEARSGHRSESRSTIDQWIEQYLIPANTFSYNGTVFPFGMNQTWTQSRTREIVNTLPAYAAALRACPPAFAAQLVRATVLSQARFVFRNTSVSATPRRTFGTRELGLLERPWPKATTGQMLAMMEWHVGLTGNAYVTRQPDPSMPRGVRLRVLRPDWVTIVFGSDREPDDPMHALDGRVIGYVYANGGFGAQGRMETLLPDEVAHWSPLPDPEGAEIGMSWVTPALRDLQADRAATEHKLAYFRNGATPNLVVKGIPAPTREQFDELVDAMEEKHRGAANAYRTLYLTAGADATVVGSNLAELDLSNVQGGSETRITYLSRVPATLLGIGAGLSGSSLNAGNFGQARRTFSDSWVYPSLQDLCAALAPLVTVPSDAELWFDVADMPLLREDARDAADIMQIKATTITTYVKEGFTPESAIAAVRGQDETLLKHTGALSVQLQKPGTETPTPPSGQQPTTTPEVTGG